MRRWDEYLGATNPLLFPEDRDDGLAGDQRRYYYNFTAGDVAVFVFDTRLDRNHTHTIGADQMAAFKAWYSATNDTANFRVRRQSRSPHACALISVPSRHRLWPL